MQRLLTFICALIGAFLVLTILSCDGTNPVAPSAEFQHSGLDAKASPATHSVTGQGTVWYDRIEPFQWLHVSITARATSETEAKGNFHWQYRSRKPGGRIFVKVSCLTVVGNEAWMVGQASQAGNPDNVGKWMGIYGEDNGERRGAAPDLLAVRWIGPDPATAEAFCADTPGDLDGTRVVQAGNIQVH